MEYAIVHPFEAVELKEKGRFSYLIEFNMSKVYILPNSKLLVVPLNPFATCILIDNESVLNEFISEQFFPVEEELKGFYFENKEKIDNLPLYKKALKDRLFNNIYGTKLKSEQVTVENINEVYHCVKKKRTHKKYKLNLIILLGDYLIKASKNKKLQWGLLANKQYLNPKKKLVLIDNLAETSYLDIEDISTNGLKIDDIEYFLKNITDYFRKTNEIETILRVFHP